jgi:hypothetical protein
VEGHSACSTHDAAVHRSIVMLLPANRPEQPWWQNTSSPTATARLTAAGEFLPGRLRFIKPGATEVKPNERPPFGCCLLIWSR